MIKPAQGPWRKRDVVYPIVGAVAFGISATLRKAGLEVVTIPVLAAAVTAGTAAMQFHGHAEKVEDRAKDQIEYVNEDRWVREKFEAELAKRGLTSLMPEAAYKDPNFEFHKGTGK
jgi:hypothetical protein